jgi:16S rRNA G966 N2-methylase RsmD
MTADSPSNKSNCFNVVLPGYQAQLGEDAVLHSQQKLMRATKNLRPFVEKDGKCSILSLPCSTEEDTLGYRCKCSFQLIQESTTNQFQYAMRKGGEPVAIGSPIFPVANRRIQVAMKDLMEKALNAGDESTTASTFPNFANSSLSSLTFAASWNDFDGQHDDQDCILTLNYNSALEDENAWVEEAKQVCSLLNLVNIHGRSKNRLLSAVSDTSQTSLGGYLRDTVYLVAPTVEDGQWQASLQQQQQSFASENVIPVFYQKPEGAFFHPNARVMCQALQWMLSRVSTIQSTGSKNGRLLEMYCGCGAHTLALAKSGMFAFIQAVELDQRLVEACKVNIDINAKGDTNLTPVEVVRGDAGQWARNYHKKKASKGGPCDSDFDVLLVDPPRQGLDAKVIDLAIQVDSIKHVLIISCGHEALVRDLTLLCDHFEVISCQQLDLFPRTDSIEALVHLQRRPSNPKESG